MHRFRAGRGDRRRHCLATARPFPFAQRQRHRYGHRTALAAGVVDRLTGLCWHRCANLAHGEVSWDAALAGIAALNSGAGPDNWRLPNINELESLVDCGRARPALATAADLFDRSGAVYWSSTTSMYEPDWAWALYLDKGAVGVGHKLQGRFSVWAVRGGLPPPVDAAGTGG